MAELKVGYTYSSNNSGDYEIEALLKGGKAIIRFHKTGNARIADIKHMKTGEVSDAIAYGSKYLPPVGSEVDYPLGESMGNGAVTLDAQGHLNVWFCATTNIDENFVAVEEPLHSRHTAQVLNHRAKAESELRESGIIGFQIDA